MHLMEEKILETFRGITFLGSRLFFLMTLFIFYFLDTNIFYGLLWAFIAGEVVTSLVKAVYFKERPNKKRYHNLIEKIDASAWPSQHSYRAVLLACGYAVFLPILALRFFLGFVAFAVLYSRFFLRKHDWIDIMSGAVLGLVLAGFFL